MEYNNDNKKMYNLFVKHLDGKTLTLVFPSPIAYANSIKDRLFEVTGIPTQQQLLVTGCRNLNDEKSALWCSPEGGNMFPSVRLLLRLKGGKGGFGSLLRGAATKAGQKKTNNFDACRDMSGRRLRHVNAEKRLEEWKAGEDERKLEKVAEEFLKKQIIKKGKKVLNDVESHKYVAKYREDSERCVAEVASSVKEALNSKRKRSEVAPTKDAKKIKIWMGKRKLNGSDSDDSDVEEENASSVNEALNSKRKRSEVAPTKDAKKIKLWMGKRKLNGSDSDDSDVEEENAKSQYPSIINNPGLSVAAEPVINCEMIEAAAMPCSESLVSGFMDCNGAVYDKFDGSVSQASNVMSSETVAGASQSNDNEIDGSMEQKVAVHEESSPSTSVPAFEEPLNFVVFNSAAELEVLGLEKLKSELQSRGLKCGGSLQERAARLFLLKSTPLDKLPKKLLAKK